MDTLWPSANFVWISHSLTTAIVLEAFCKSKLTGLE